MGKREKTRGYLEIFRPVWNAGESTGTAVSIRNIQDLQRRITKYAFSPRLHIRIFAAMKIKIKLNKFKASFCPCAP